MESFFIKQIEMLTNQVQALTEENKLLNMKIISLLEKKENTELIEYNNNSDNNNSDNNIPDYDDWIKTFDKYLTFNDIKFDTKNFVDASMHCLIKVLEKNKCIRTINKKKKLIKIKRNGIWEEISFIEFLQIVKKITDNCIKVLHKLMLNYKKNNPQDYSYEESHSHIIICMFSDINEYKETIANKLIELNI